MKDNHLLRGLMLERVDREKRDHVENELRKKLKRYEESYTKSQGLVESLQNEKESWATKLSIKNTKAKESPP